MGVSILKGVKIDDNNIVAANSTITKSSFMHNSIISTKGIIKTNINWKS